MKPMIRLLITNSGSTSTKLAIYENDRSVFSETIRHSPAELEKFPSTWEQYDFRKAAILETLRANNHQMSDFTAVVSRGGVFKPISSGVYLISEAMIADAQSGRYGQHACGVGCQIAFDLAKEFNLSALTVDPPCSDEMLPEAHYAGLPWFSRKSWFQALNQKAVARRQAALLGKEYRQVNIIVAHMGGGMSIAAHRQGLVIDVNNGLDGDGPMAPERAGTVPAGDLITMCFSGEYGQSEIRRLINGRGGLLAYLGTTDGGEIEKRISAGDEKAREVYESMIYQIAKSIGGAAASLKGQVEAIALTGGLAYSNYLTNKLKHWVAWIAPVYIFPGENEMEFLAQGALRYLRDQETAQPY